MIRKAFRSYLPLRKDERDDIWKNGLIIFDTNVLLEIYRLSTESKNTFFKVISEKDIANRLWLPYQVMKEFFCNRTQVILEQTLIVDKIKAAIQRYKENLIEEINKIPIRKEHPFINMDEVKNFFLEKIKESEIYIDKKLENHPNHLEEDNILEKIEEIFSYKIGEKPSEDSLNNQINEANEKYKNSTGIGQKDSEKDGEKKYGDYFIWKEIIFKSKDTNKPVIFITNEEKEDYWLKSHGKKIGIRYEHRQEFINETGQDILIYSLHHFLENANNYLKNLQNISSVYLEKLLNEIENNSTFKKEQHIYEKLFKENKNENIYNILKSSYYDKLISEHQKLIKLSNKINKIESPWKDLDFIKKLNFLNEITNKLSSENSSDLIKDKSTTEEEIEKDNT